MSELKTYRLTLISRFEENKSQREMMNLLLFEHNARMIRYKNIAPISFSKNKWDDMITKRTKLEQYKENFHQAMIDASDALIRDIERDTQQG